MDNAQVDPDIDLVAGIYEYLQVKPRRRGAIMSAAGDGWATRWWQLGTARMGRRQARYADLESGNRKISEYALALIPGLPQTLESAGARMRCDPAR